MNGRTILYVEDDFLCRHLVNTILTADGYEIVEAKDANEAFAAIEHMKPDLVIMDIYLPGGINGIELTEKIRTLSALEDVPVLVLTTDYEWYNRTDILAAGFSQHLAKPFSRQDLLKAVHQLIGANAATV